MNQQSCNRAALYARSAYAPPGSCAIENQLFKMREFALCQGWDAVAEFIDDGVSGATLERPSLQAMKSAAAEGEFDILLVYDLARLSRKIFDTFALLQYLRDHNVICVTVQDPEFWFLGLFGLPGSLVGSRIDWDQLSRR